MIVNFFLMPSKTIFIIYTLFDKYSIIFPKQQQGILNNVLQVKLCCQTYELFFIPPFFLDYLFFLLIFPVWYHVRQILSYALWGGKFHHLTQTTSCLQYYYPFFKTILFKIRFNCCFLFQWSTIFQLSIITFWK